MKMLTLIETNDEKLKFYTREINADAAAWGDVMLGRPTDNEIIEWANEYLLAPECGDYNDYSVVRI